MAYDQILTPAWKGFLRYASGPNGEKIRREYFEETGNAIYLRGRQSDNDNGYTRNESLWLFAAWVTLACWGTRTGVPDEFYRGACLMWPDLATQTEKALAEGALRIVN